MFTERAGEIRKSLRLLRGVDLTEAQQARIMANSVNLEDPQDEADRRRDEAAAETMFHGLGVQIQRPDRVIRLAGITRLEDLFGAEAAQIVANNGDVRDWRGSPVRVMNPDDRTPEEDQAIRDRFGLDDGIEKPDVHKALVESALSKLSKARFPQIPADAYVLTHEGDSFLIIPQRPLNTPTSDPASGR